MRSTETTNPRSDVLYLTSEGLLEPLGHVRTANLVERLAGYGFAITVVSFEKRSALKDEARTGAVRAKLEGHGIQWRPLPYHVSGELPIACWDLPRAATAAIRIAREHRPRVLHCCGYVSGLIGLAIKFACGGKLIFDMQGFWPEERVELGLLRSTHFLYRASKRIERTLLNGSDHVVVATERAKAVLRDEEAKARLASERSVPEKPVSVIPRCVELEKFSPRECDETLAATCGLGKKLLLGNIGAFNRRYLVSEMFRFAFHVKKYRPDATFIYLTPHDPRAVHEAARSAGLVDEGVFVQFVEPSDIPRWLSLFRLGVFFLRPSYAAKGSSFTKLAEFLASGVPVVTNTGVGDLDRVLSSEKCGLLLPGLTDRDLDRAARSVLPLFEGDCVPRELRERCRRTAVGRFGIAYGASKYRSIYRSLDVVEEALGEIPGVIQTG